MMVSKKLTRENNRSEDPAQTVRGSFYHALIASLSFVGVAVGAYLMIQSIIKLSYSLGTPEYLISFFMMAIGTSLPELVVDMMALRKGQYRLAIGDIIGSCVVDVSLAIGIGPLIFPQNISGRLATVTALYTFIASAIVVMTLAARGKVDRKAGLLFIILYAASYLVPSL